jgi:hypothetical protein
MKSNGLNLMLDYIESENLELTRQALRCIKNICVLDDAKMELVEPGVIERLVKCTNSSEGAVKKKALEILALIVTHGNKLVMIYVTIQ